VTSVTFVFHSINTTSVSRVSIEWAKGQYGKRNDPYINRLM